MLLAAELGWPLDLARDVPVLMDDGRAVDSSVGEDWLLVYRFLIG